MAKPHKIEVKERATYSSIEIDIDGKDSYSITVTDKGIEITFNAMSDNVLAIFPRVSNQVKLMGVDSAHSLL